MVERALHAAWVLPAFVIMGAHNQSGGHSLDRVTGQGLSLQLELANELEAGGIARETPSGIPRPGENFARNPGNAAFTGEIKAACQPHEFVIVFGILESGGDTVLVREAGALEPLQRVPVPDSLGGHGLVAYAALPAVPSELLVREPDGKTIFSENLAAIEREASETCEGESEG